MHGLSFLLQICVLQIFVVASRGEEGPCNHGTSCTSQDNSGTKCELNYCLCQQGDLWDESNSKCEEESMFSTNETSQEGGMPGKLMLKCLHSNQEGGAELTLTLTCTSGSHVNFHVAVCNSDVIQGKLDITGKQRSRKPITVQRFTQSKDCLVESPAIGYNIKKDLLQLKLDGQCDVCGGSTFSVTGLAAACSIGDMDFVSRSDASQEWENRVTDEVYKFTAQVPDSALEGTVNIRTPNKNLTSPHTVSVEMDPSIGGAVTVKWSMDSQYPGRVRFYVQLIDYLENTTTHIDQQHMDITSRADWSEANFAFPWVLAPGLWLYAFRVEAVSFDSCSTDFSTSSTNKGTTSDLSGPVQSPDEKAEPVSFTLDDKGAALGEVTVIITELSPRQRNVRYSHYVLRVNPLVRGENQQTLVVTSKLNETQTVEDFLTFREATTYRRLVKVHPGKTYQFGVAVAIVKPSGALKILGKQAKKSYVAKVGPPPKPPNHEDDQVQPAYVSSSESEVTFFLADTAFFHNASNGPIVDRGILVAGDKHGRPRVYNGSYRTADSYIKAMQKNTNSFVYRVDFLALRNPGYKYLRLTLGTSDPKTSSECVRKSHSCNGPLMSNTLYRVSGFACTSGGCSKIRLLTTRTKATPVDSDITLVVALCVSSIILVVLLAAGVIFRVYCWTQKSLKLHISSSASTALTMRQVINPSKPICLGELADTVDKMHSNSDLEFQKEFGEILSNLPDWPFYKGAVVEKNRYMDIQPYTDSVVLLSEQNDDPTTRYINASFIPGYLGGREFIATQGPVLSTVPDFWRMVWERDIQLIVMLTQTREGRLDKCAQYWPAQRNTSGQYEDIQVTCTSVSCINHYTITIFELKNDKVPDVTREVKHFHYLTWKDQTASIPVTDLVQFVTDVRSHVPPHLDSPPILVHCSAGVGRTGTFIAIDYIHQLIQSRGMEDTVDILAFVASMRRHRPLMVQTEKQYVLVHDCAKHMIQIRQQQDRDEQDDSDDDDDEDDNYGENKGTNIKNDEQQGGKQQTRDKDENCGEVMNGDKKQGGDGVNDQKGDKVQKDTSDKDCPPSDTNGAKVASTGISGSDF